MIVSLHQQKNTTMKTNLKKFQVFTWTDFGIGMLNLKAKSPSDCLNRISAKNRSRLLYIDDENGERHYFND